MKNIFGYTALTGIFIYAVFASTSIAVAQGGLILALIGWAGKCVLSRRPLIPNSPLNIPVFLFVILSLLAALLGINVLHSLDGLRTYTFAALIFLIPTIVPDRNLRRLFWCFILLAGAGGCIYFFVRGYLSAGNVWMRVSMGESGRMIPLFGAAAGLAASEDRWSRRIPLLAVIALLLAGAATNLHRGPWVGMLAAGFAVCWFRSKKLLLILPVIVALCAMFPPIRGRAYQAVDQMRQQKILRLKMWAVTPEIIAQYPYGVGQDNTGDVQEPRTGKHSHFHNNFVNIAIESGILALIVWSWWMIVFLKLTYDTWKRLPEEKRLEKGVCLGAWAATVGFLVAGIVEYNFGDSEIAMMMYFLMGCVLLVWRQTRLSGSVHDDRMAGATS